MSVFLLLFFFVCCVFVFCLFSFVHGICFKCVCLKLRHILLPLAQRSTFKARRLRVQPLSAVH